LSARPAIAKAINSRTERLPILFARGEHERLRVLSTARKFFTDSRKYELINYRSDSLRLLEQSDKKLVMEMFYILVGLASGQINVDEGNGLKGVNQVDATYWQFAADIFKSFGEEKQAMGEQLRSYFGRMSSSGAYGMLVSALKDIEDRIKIQAEVTPSEQKSYAFYRAVMDSAQAVEDEAPPLALDGSLDASQRVTPGGIDFDIKNVNLDIQSDGQGVQINFDPAMLRSGNFSGLTPVILNVTPISDLPLFLGAARAPEEKLAGAGV
jgi:hypothetical protein